MPKKPMNIYVDTELVEYIRNQPDKKPNEVVTEAVTLLRQGNTPKENLSPSKFTVTEVRI